MKFTSIDKIGQFSAYLTEFSLTGYEESETSEKFLT